MSTVVIHTPRNTKEDCWETISNTIDMGNGPQDIFFRMSPGPGPTNSNFILPWILFPAMKAGKHVEFSDPLSEKLLSSLNLIQDIFHMWFPSFQKITVKASPRVVSVINGCFALS